MLHGRRRNDVDLRICIASLEYVLLAVLLEYVISHTFFIMTAMDMCELLVIESPALEVHLATEQSSLRPGIKVVAVQTQY